MKTSKIPVLIVGAGPTGLMAAAQLQRFNVPYRIIEKREGTTPFSKALGVQARTMEIYEQMGFVDKALKQGLAANEVHAMVKGTFVQKIPLSTAGADVTPYPFLFVLEQSRNEELIYDYITNKGGKVEWNTEMLDFNMQEDQTLVQVRHQDDSKEQIVADWVIAADGGRSPIRHYLEMPFKGDTYKNVFYVVDTEVEWDKEPSKLYINLAENNFTAFFPIMDEKGQRYRLVGILPESFYDKEDITFEDIKHDIENLQHIDLSFGKTYWFSVYRVHHRCIEQFKKGRVFFAGDSAHVHSPAGGQGMNTGLQDAYNLAWKLALVVQDKAPESLLDSYNEERLPVAHRLVDTTDRAFSTVVKKGTLINWFRLNIMPFFMSKIMGISAIQRRAFRIVSQTGISYRDSAIAINNATLNKHEPHAGDRLPYVLVQQNQQQQSIYKLLGEQGFQVICWLKNPTDNANEITTYLEQQHADSFHIHTIANNNQNAAAFKTLNLRDSVIYIVRPDNYIGYIGSIHDLDGIKAYLSLILR